MFPAFQLSGSSHDLHVLLRHRQAIMSPFVSARPPSAEAALDRAQAWLHDDATEQALVLGDRLWILHGEAEPLFEGALRTRVAGLYPKAHIEQLTGGLVSRPGVMAAWVRGLTNAYRRVS